MNLKCFYFCLWLLDDLVLQRTRFGGKNHPEACLRVVISSKARMERSSKAFKRFYLVLFTNIIPYICFIAQFCTFCKPHLPNMSIIRHYMSIIPHLCPIFFVPLRPNLLLIRIRNYTMRNLFTQLLNFAKANELPSNLLSICFQYAIILLPNTYSTRRRDVDDTYSTRTRTILTPYRLRTLSVPSRLAACIVLILCLGVGQMWG